MPEGQDFTLSIWIRTTEEISSAPVAKHDTGYLNGYLIGLNDSAGYGDAGKAWFYYSFSPGQEAVSKTTVNDDDWHHIVCVYDADDADCRIYVDGQHEDTADTSPVISSPGPFAIGGVLSNGELVPAFDGLVDDVQVYDTKLSDADVLFLFDNPGEELPCPADVNGDGNLNVLDFVAFQQLWQAADGSADCDANGAFNVLDFVCFQQLFVAGCD